MEGFKVKLTVREGPAPGQGLQTAEPARGLSANRQIGPTPPGAQYAGRGAPGAQEDFSQFRPTSGKLLSGKLIEDRRKEARRELKR